MAKARDTVHLIQKQNGLNFQYDPLERPEGSLIRANNVWANREGMLESRRGFDRYGDAFPGPTAPGILGVFEFDGALMRHGEGAVIQYEIGIGPIWSSYAGSFDAPSGQKMRNVEARLSNYITTDEGIFSQTGKTVAPTRAGIEPFLELTLAFTGTGGGHLLADSRAGYRGVWYRKDANNKELRGAPSWAEWISNPYINATWAWVGPGAGTVTVTTPANHGYTTGDTVEIANAVDGAGAAEPNIDGSYTITVTAPTTYTYTPAAAPVAAAGTLDQTKDYDATVEFAIPDDVVAGDSYEIYRTEPSASAATQPTEEYYLVESVEVTSADITAGVITYTDNVVSGILDTDRRLYTNPSQGTIAKSNDRPPLAYDITYYKGHLILANVAWEQEVEFQFRDTSAIVTGSSTVILGAETYTFEVAENVGLKEFQLFTAGTLAENLADTMKSFVRVVNRGSAVYYAFYTSGATGSPGKVLVRHRACGSSDFQVKCNHVNTGNSFMPKIPVGPTGLYSDAPGGVNVVAISKFEQPDAVPRSSIEPLGSETNALLRCLALRDSCLFFKEQGGVHVMSGETDGATGKDFSFKVRDETLRILGAATARVMSNRVFLYSNEGFVAMDENGAEIIGREVEEEVERIHALASWDSLAFAVPYDSEDMYLCFGPYEAADTTCTYCWAYNDITKRFVHGFVKPISAGHNLRSDDKLYLAHGVDNFVLKERKSLNIDNQDYRDEEIDITINSATSVVNDDGITVSQLEVAYTYAGVALQRGFQISQGSWTTEIVSVSGDSSPYTVECVEFAPFSAGAATVFIPIFVDIKFSDVFGSNASMIKQLMSVQFEFEDDRAFSHYVGFATDYVPTEEFNDEPYSIVGLNAGWGRSQWGAGPWGDPGDLSKTPIIVTPPKDYSRFRRLNICYKHEVAGEKVGLCQVAVRSRDISMRGRAKSPRS